MASPTCRGGKRGPAVVPGEADVTNTTITGENPNTFSGDFGQDQKCTTQ